MLNPFVHLFLEAVTIEALPLKERPMAKFIREKLEGLPLRVHEDETASAFGGECGNLICIPYGYDPKRPSFALLAHMDTPRSTADVHPVVTDARISSDGTTALGVDNRAGVSILLHTLRHHLSERKQPNILVVFTAAEEIGPYGSRYLDLSSYNVRMCFVFDCSRRPGTFIKAAVGCSLYKAQFIGKAAHAAVAPETGVNAIHVAAKALAQMSIGRLSEKMTANIGMIDGGHATNVVPNRCSVKGEVRGFDLQDIANQVAGIERLFRETSDSYGAQVEFSSEVDFPPFQLDEEAEIVRLTKVVLRQVGLSPQPIDYLGGSDANELNAKGIPTVNLGIGAQNPHSNDEFILIEDLHKSVEIALALMERSATLEAL